MNRFLRPADVARAIVLVFILLSVWGPGSGPALDVPSDARQGALVLGIAGATLVLAGARWLLAVADSAGPVGTWIQRSAGAAVGALVGPAAEGLYRAVPFAGHRPDAQLVLTDVARLTPVALLLAAVLFVPVPAAVRSGLARHARRVGVAATASTVLITSVAVAPGAAQAAPVLPADSGTVCPSGARVVTYDLAAFAVDIPLNGWGDHLPQGLMYALSGSDARIGQAQIKANPQLAQPVVIRANVGDCIRITLRNDIPAAYPAGSEPAPAPGAAGHPPAKPPTRVGIHPDGLVQFDPTDSDGARVGGNPDSSVGRGEQRTYTWYADHEGQAPLVDIANLDAGRDGGNSIQHGLFGAVIVHPAGSSWHDQITRADMLDAATGRAVATDVAADVHVPGGPSFRSFARVIMDEIEGVKDRAGRSPTFPTTGLADSTFGINYRSEPLRNRLRAILEHRGTKTPENPQGIARTITLPNGRTYAPADHFCDGYVPELDKVVDDPGAKCMSEESHLQSWVFGDEGKLTRREPDGRIVTDSDVMIAKAYRGDPVRFHLIHPGVKETHPWHQHTQRWFADPHNTRSPRKDVQSLGPGEAFELDIEGGAGGVQGTIGDSIHHCHLYPHFAQGFWGHERIFDRLRDGTQSYPDGTPLQALQPLPDRLGQTPAPDALHPGFPLFVKGDVGQRAYRIPYAVVKDNFSAVRRPGDTIRGPNALETANLPALDQNKPGAGAIDPCPAVAPVRAYHPHALDLPLTYNKAGWTDRQGRLYVEESHVDAVRSGRESPQPYTIRARQGDCVQVFTTNDLHLDENPAVPLDHVNRLDGAYRTGEETSEISTHVHLVQFDELGSDGTSVGWNYVQAAMPGQTYGYRWFVDQPLRTVFFHDHQYPNLHQQKGLFAALNVEPADATWTDPGTGAPTDGTGPMADIHSAAGPHFREFTLFYSDRVPMWRDGGSGRPVAPPGTVDDFGADQGGYAINYRNEPLQIRTAPGKPGLKGDPAYVYSSAVHGDPSTPLLRAHTGDPVVIRQVTGAHERVHDFNLHGHRWLSEPDNPSSTMTDVQGAALAEYFNFELVSGRPLKAYKTQRELRADGGLNAANGGPALVASGAGAPGDYLYGSTALDDQWLGMWGIFRTSDKRVPGLVPLPDRPMPGRGDPWPALHPGEPVKAAPPASRCPATSPVRRYDIAAIAQPILYNARTGDNDPDGLMYVLSADEAAVRSGAKAPTPLVLRANAGDCLKITLSNHLPETGPPRHGDDVALPANAPFPRGNRISLHAGMVDTPVIQGDGTTVGYNFDQTLAPGETRATTWYVSTGIGNPSIPLTDFGDRVGNPHHGLFGALLVEPPGAVWLDPTTGKTATGTAAEIRWTDGTTPRTTREFVAIWQDGLTLRAPDGSVLPTALPPGHLPTDLDPYDRGHRGINYRTERFAPREAVNPEPAWVLSSAVHGDPATPVFRAYPGDGVWLRVLHGADRGRAHTVVVSGHSWHYQAADPNSTIRSAAGMLLPQTGWTLDLICGAGGPGRRAGDYLVRDGLATNQVNAGLWFLLRVEATPQPDLRPLGAPERGVWWGFAEWSDGSVWSWSVPSRWWQGWPGRRRRTWRSAPTRRRPAPPM
jgi:hypothetical protein